MHFHRQLHHLWVLLVCFLLAMVLWMPQQLNMPPTEDEWGHYALLDRAVMQGKSPFGFAVDPTYSRPLFYLWWSVTYAIESESFVVVNWLIAVSLFVRTVLIYAIFKRLIPIHLALAAALVSLIIPIDYGFFNRGVMQIQLAVTFYFGAVFLFLNLVARPRLITALAMLFILILACGGYESQYPLIAITPLLAVYKERRLSRRVLALSLLWYAVPILMLLIFALPAITSPSSYQRTLLTPDLSAAYIATTIFTGYRQTLLTTWSIALRASQSELLLPRLAAAIAVFVAFMTLPALPSIQLKQRLLLLGAGVVLVGAGFAMYLPTTVIAIGGERAYMFSAFGAGLVIAVLLESVTAYSVRQRWVYGLLVSVVVFAFSAAMVTSIRSGVVNRGQQQATILRGITSIAPALIPDTTLVIIFEPGTVSPFPLISGDYIASAVNYVYHDGYAHRVATCYDGNCTAAEWDTLNDMHLLVFRVNPELQVQLMQDVPELKVVYDPLRWIDAEAAAPSRMQSLYAR